MTDSNERKVRSIARAAQTALARAKMTVEWKSLALVPTDHGPLAVLEVDLAAEGCPPVKKLDHDDTVHQISTYLRLPVVRKNQHGIYYGVLLQPSKKLRIPDKAELPEPPGRMMVPFGMTARDDLWVPLPEMDALLVAGTTGFGKSTFLNMALASLLAHHGPDELQVALIDLKVVELFHWDSAPHLLAPVARDDDSALAVMQRVAGIIEERKALFAAARANRFERYCEKTGDTLPRVLLVIDELAEMNADLAVLQSIRQTGRAFGVHAIVSTQFPNAETVASIINANIPNRITGWLPSDDWYRMTLKPAKGERFPRPEMTPGRMVGRVQGQWVTFQGFWLSDKELERIGRDVTAGKIGGGLSEKEIRMVEIAVRDRGGKLTQANIAASLNLTPYKAEQKSAEWQSLGWLRKEPSDNNACYVTEAFQKLAERSRRFQAVPDVPGS